MEQGLIHIYHGDGKGKTTCAFGLALRCAGCGYRVRIVQFLKGRQSGEIRAMQAFDNVELLRTEKPPCFTWQMTEQQKQQSKLQCEQLLREAFAQTDDIRLLVLDEVLIAILTGMLEEEQLVALLEHRPAHLEVVLTGRHPSKKLRSMAHYITELRKEKHPYDNGIMARHGIEM